MLYMVELFELLLELSKATDLVSPRLNHHQHQVGFIACCLGEQMGFSKESLNTIGMAGILHDIGGLSLQERIDVLKFDAIHPHRHARIGWQLLKENTNLTEIAEIIKFHHVDWDNGSGIFFNGEAVPLESHLIHLADRISTSINPTEDLINQGDAIYEKIKRASGRKFNPAFVEAFAQIRHFDYFWFDLESIMKGNNLYRKFTDFSKIQIDLEGLLDISRLFSRVIDFRSPFTAVHSVGVACVGAEIGKLCGLNDDTCQKIKIAGYLHDLGKLAISNEVLEKPDRLTEKEFSLVKAHVYETYILLDRVNGMQEITAIAALHHEKMDGSGYPFKLSGDQLSYEARILAIADIFTALTENRPYRKGMSQVAVKEIFNELKNENKLDPAILEVVDANYELLEKVRISSQSGARDHYQRLKAETDEPSPRKEPVFDPSAWPDTRSYLHQEEAFQA
ncbi:HD domain-containing protein [Eubacteriaceae bacterium ES3]|nr:HD domain-containing protein [Eubacteriaceae bacterium ES3]